MIISKMISKSIRLRRRSRRAFSLLEMLLALSILGGSLAILSQIASTGLDAAREARDLSVARILCQTKLSEILLDATAGVAPQSFPAAPLESFDTESTTPFTYSADVQPGTIDGILIVRVTVIAENPDGGPPIATCSLVRWLIDPTLGLEAAAEEEQLMLEEAAAAAAGETQ